MFWKCWQVLLGREIGRQKADQEHQEEEGEGGPHQDQAEVAGTQAVGETKHWD